MRLRFAPRFFALLGAAIALSMFGACGDAGRSTRLTPSDTGAPPPQPFPSLDAALDSEAADVADEPTASAALHVYPRRGAPPGVDDAVAPAGPGIVLDGGFGGQSVLAWMHHTATGDVANRADVAILTAYASDVSDGWLSVAPFHSVQTVAIGKNATEVDFQLAAEIISHAEIVWFTGGDQAAYVRWKDTPVIAAARGVHARGGVIGGLSAGMIILGASVNDATKTLSENITSAVCLSDPYDPTIHFTQGIFRLPPLVRTITDPHFVAANRMGRLATFMGRQVADGFATPDILGIGVQDGAALVIDNMQRGRRLGVGDAGVFVIRGGLPQQMKAGAPVIHPALHVVKLQGDDDTFDFNLRCGRGFVKDVDVDGTQSPAYPADVYANGAPANECP